MLDFWNFLPAVPSEPGWYAALVCYDPQEGVFPQARRWTGNEWDGRGVVAFGEMAPTVAEAEALAYEHDPDYPATL